MSDGRVGPNLAAMRERRMWTQARLAREAGVSPTTVSGIEGGRISRPHFGTLRKLARALEVPAEELLGEISPGPLESGEQMSLEWARSAREEEFERRLDGATLHSLNALSRELDEEHGRLRTLYGEFPKGSEQRRFIKRQIRDISGRSGSVGASIEFHDDWEEP
ncbi:MAG TPA: helix-turn-helix transcriptional regulator [Rubrobacteraceae bacterium]|nr:helix-turn-helix transcriptional regulator [Rubrobacteraceae bacterium]